jgi:uncharacterized protein
MKKALIVQGGWDGHEPVEISERFKKLLEKEDFIVTVADTLDAFLDVSKLKELDLIVPVWTMGQIKNEQAAPVLEAIASGVGIAGCHGGMCDSFRDNVDWQFMTGGQWVSHPGGDGVEYTINIRKGSSPLIEGIEDFIVKSEQYYMHVDPAVEILATTDFPIIPGNHSTNGKVVMPITWTKRWGLGRVFYTSLGHHNDVFDDASALEMMRRGLLWAASGKGNIK